MADAVTGRCFCGAVRFRFDRPPIAARACWCRDCQYLAAGNATVNAIFRVEGMSVTGALGEYVSTADSGNTMRRRFCPTCGTPMFSESHVRPDLIVVRAGALDDPAIARPGGFIWTKSAPSWGYVDPSLANCEGQPPPVRRG